MEENTLSFDEQDMDLRELKALELAARSKIEWTGKHWSVPSQSSGAKYKVTLTPESCECEDFALRQLACKHVTAARLVCYRDFGGKQPEPKIVVDEVPKRKTYPQNWKSYDESQTTEKRRLQVLLADLCAGFPEPPRQGAGRKPVPVADRLFAVVFKVYCGMSARRYMTDMEDAFAAGHLSRTACYSKVCSLFRDPELTAPLKAMVERSAMPLRAVEVDFAVDSTGFSVSKFVRWFDEKYGVERSGRDWVKVHACVGVKTNVITAVEIKGRDTNDCPLLPDLVRTTALNGFTIKEVSGDKGYLSAENVETVAALGGQAFIAPKSNTTGAAGGLFERMFHFYQFNREEFLRHYHKRSNVESTFSAVKRKFGDNVRSREAVSMVNEALCKIVCFNLTRVILSQIELGIEAVFWKDEPKEDGPRDVLPMVRPG
jgi:transposase